uniref:hypothetical protein n=1 Tax=Muricoccus aerilatus TaxID=452982 RepID=UPI0005C17577
MEKKVAYHAAFHQLCDAKEAGNKAEERRLDIVQHALAAEQEEPVAVIIETMATTLAGRVAKTRFSEFLSESSCNQEYACGLEQGLNDEAAAI